MWSLIPCHKRQRVMLLLLPGYCVRTKPPRPPRPATTGDSSESTYAMFAWDSFRTNHRIPTFWKILHFPGSSQKSEDDTICSCLSHLRLCKMAGTLEALSIMSLTLLVIPMSLPQLHCTSFCYTNTRGREKSFLPAEYSSCSALCPGFTHLVRVLAVPIHVSNTKADGHEALFSASSEHVSCCKLNLQAKF